MTVCALPQGEWLNVGSGPHVAPGWISIDGSWQARLAGYPALARVAAVVAGRDVGHWPRGIVCRDVRKGLGRAAGSAAVIYSSHVIEHLRRVEAVQFLTDCRAALCPGGVCRIVTPDLAALIARYAAHGNGSGLAAEEFMRATLLADANGQRARGMLAWYRHRTRFETHKWLYDAASLCALFEEAGFREPRERAFLDSGIPRDVLASVELRERIENGAGLVVEARA